MENERSYHCAISALQSYFLRDMTNDGVSIQSAMEYYVPLRISKFGSPNQLLLYSTKLFRNILLLTTDHSSIIIAVFPGHGQTSARRKIRANKESIEFY